LDDYYWAELFVMVKAEKNCEFSVSVPTHKNGLNVLTSKEPVNVVLNPL